MSSFNFRLKSVLANTKMEEAILELYEELDKEKCKNPMMDLSQRRSLKIRKFTETIGKYDNPLLREIASLKAKLVEVTEEHKVSMSLNSKTVNSLVKMNEKTGCCHVILIYGLIPPSASKNRVHTLILPD